MIKAAEYYQKLKSEGVLQSDLTLKFSDLVTNFGLGKIGMMPFAGDWVSEAITKELTLMISDFAFLRPDLPENKQPQSVETAG